MNLLNETTGTDQLHEWMTAAEAACYMRCAIKTLYNYKCSGKLRGYNRGNSRKGELLFRKSDLEAFIVGKRGA